jgi:hypothetical protein
VRPSVLPNISRQTLIPNTVAEGPLFTIPESDPNAITTPPFVIPTAVEGSAVCPSVPPNSSRQTLIPNHRSGGTVEEVSGLEM